LDNGKLTHAKLLLSNTVQSVGLDAQPPLGLQNEGISQMENGRLNYRRNSDLQNKEASKIHN
jgi:hypothetical protein